LSFSPVEAKLTGMLRDETGAGRLEVFGVEVLDVAMEDAIHELGCCLLDDSGRSHSVFFVNANTLNLAWSDPSYRRDLHTADYVFGDGTGVRWAARALHAARLRDNVNGTDLVPHLLRSFDARGLRLFLLGSTPEVVARAAETIRRTYTGWEVAGAHHGFIEIDASSDVVDQINASRPHLLLVAMGNPKQERWIAKHRPALRVPLSIGVGGLFAYWSGDLERAPRWMRRAGVEWVYLLLRQPRKASRYLLGNPLFLSRLAGSKWLGAKPRTGRTR
jgi:N-acetylglucosaminyldiphosphoundecaprenol N-acetyl-beta-D-mannosaminyltransferase